MKNIKINRNVKGERKVLFILQTKSKKENRRKQFMINKSKIQTDNNVMYEIYV